MPYPLPPTLSPSRVSAFTECALAFRFANLDRLPEPPAPHLTRGSLVHLALERLFMLPAVERTPAQAGPCLDAAVAALRDDDEFRGLGLDADGEAAFVAEARRLVDRYFTMEDPAAVHAVGLELRLRAEVGGVELTGIIDRLDRTPDGGFMVVDYKGLALDTPLPTPSGWTTMAEVSVGDEVFGADGDPARVIAKSAVHRRPCYRIVFSDGSEVVCDNEHLWNVGQVGAAWRGDRTDKTVDADTLYEMHRRCRAEGRPRGLVVRNAAALELPEATVPLDPWLLGAWLGDGRSSGGSITVGQEDLEWMLEQFDRLPFAARPENSARTGAAAQISLNRPHPDLCLHGHAYDGATRTRGTRRYRLCRECRLIEARARWRRATPSYGPSWNCSLQAVLRSLGLLGNKHVPASYLRGSRGQRLALLQGLMDTDGHWHGQRRRAVFVTTTPALAEGLRELVHSLGVSSYMFTRHQENAVRADTTVHHIEFRPTGFNPFRLPRKAEPVAAFLAGVNNARDRSFLGHATRRAILDIHPIDSVPTQCIAVDAPNSLYLCGPTMVPTHNTGSAPSERHERGRLNGVDTYALLCERVLGVLPTAVRLLYLGDGTTLTCVPTAHTTRFIEQKVGAVWVTIQRANASDSFRPKPGRLCEWCSFQTFCPAFGGNPEAARRLGEELQAGRRGEGNVAGLHDEPLRFDDAAAGAASAAG